MGRRKIEMKLVKDRSARQVTFSKRRTGLFKKAHELATLCAAKIAIVVFSPGGKPFSFGTPDVDSVADMFLNQDQNSPSAVSDSDNDDKPKSGNAAAERMNRELDSLLSHIELEKKRGGILAEKMKKAAAGDGGGCGLEFTKPVSKMGMEELVEMKRKLLEMRRELEGRAMEMEASSSLLLLSEKAVTGTECSVSNCRD